MNKKRLKLKARMKELNFGIEDLASAGGFTNAWAYKVLAGTRTPSLEVCRTIAEWLGRTIEELFFDDEKDEMSQELTETRESA